MTYIDTQQHPPLRDVIQTVKSEINAALRVCLPVEVTKVNLDGTVDVIPSLTQMTPQVGSPLDLASPYPELKNCPVQYAQGGGIGFVPPVSVGDTGMIIFSDRCLDSWKINGTPAPLPSYRMHDISDGIVIIGLNVLTNPLKRPQIPFIPSDQAGGIYELVTKENPLASAAIEINAESHRISIRNATVGAPGTPNSLAQILTGLATSITSLNAALTALNIVINSESSIPLAGAAALAANAAIVPITASLGILITSIEALFY